LNCIHGGDSTHVETQFQHLYFTNFLHLFRFCGHGNR
jgi:hypothetical protein